MKIQLLTRPDHALYLYNSLKKDNDIKMVTFNVSKDKGWLQKLRPTIKVVDDDVKILYNLIIFKQCINHLNKFLNINVYKWERIFAEWAYSFSKSQEYDIVHYWPIYCHSYIKRIRKQYGIKTVADVYELYPDFFEEHINPELQKHGVSTTPYFKTIDRTQFLEHEKNIIVCSKLVKENYAKHIKGTNIYVAEYGFLGKTNVLKAYKNGLDHFNKGNKLNIVFVGTISIEKGCIDLLEAMRSLKKSNIHLDLIGTVAHNQKDIFSKYINDQNIKFIGKIPNKELQDKLVDYDLLVIPSLADAYSISSIEALSNALPIIISNNTGIKDEVLKYNIGEVVPIKQPMLLKDTILKFTDIEYRRFLSENILNFIKADRQFGYAEKVKEIYNSL